MKMTFEAVKPAIGAIVSIDRSDITDASVAQRCLELLEKHGALVFPRIGLSDKEQLAFTDQLGARVNFTPNAWPRPTVRSA